MTEQKQYTLLKDAAQLLEKNREVYVAQGPGTDRNVLDLITMCHRLTTALSTQEFYVKFNQVCEGLEEIKSHTTTPCENTPKIVHGWITALLADVGWE